MALVTLISGDRNSHWYSESTRTVVVPSWKAFRLSLLTALRKWEPVVDRLIVDRTVECPELLYFLRSLPDSFRGDVLFIDRDESSLLSQITPHGKRMLYMLTSADVRGYLENLGFFADAVTRVAA